MLPQKPDTHTMAKIYRKYESVGFSTAAFPRSRSEGDGVDAESAGLLSSRVVSSFLRPKLMGCAICGKQKPG